MPAFTHSHFYGGDPSQGSCVSIPGQDAKVTVGGQGVLEIEEIIFNYAWVGYSPTIALTRGRGRLIIVEGDPDQQLSPASWSSGADILSGQTLPFRILFDMPMNIPNQAMLPQRMRFPSGETMGALRTSDGGKLSVILIAGTAESGGTINYIFLQCLHVLARQIR